jgi:hypothetical protein
VLGRRAITDLGAVAILLVELLVLFNVKKAPEPVVILAVGGVGFVVSRIAA